jgi:hypothetical protein
VEMGNAGGEREYRKWLNEFGTFEIGWSFVGKWYCSAYLKSYDCDLTDILVYGSISTDVMNGMGVMIPVFVYRAASLGVYPRKWF